MIGELAAMLAAFLGATVIALALGAVNTGTAIGVGQIAFALALVALLLRRRS